MGLAPPSQSVHQNAYPSLTSQSDAPVVQTNFVKLSAAPLMCAVLRMYAHRLQSAQKMKTSRLDVHACIQTSVPRIGAPVFQQCVNRTST